MITVMNRDTCRDAYIDEKLIVRMEEMTETLDDRAYPFTRVYVFNTKEGHDYYIDAIESKRRIQELINKAVAEHNEEAAREKSFTEMIKNAVKPKAKATKLKKTEVEKLPEKKKTTTKSTKKGKS